MGAVTSLICTTLLPAAWRRRMRQEPIQGTEPSRPWRSPTSTAKTGWSSRPSPTTCATALGWESVYAYNDGDLRPARHAGPRVSEREVVLMRDLRAALARLNPDLPDVGPRAGGREADAHRLLPLAAPAQPRVLRLHPRRRAGRVARRAAARRRHARAQVIDFRQRPAQQPLPRRARAEDPGPARAALQPPRRSGLLRQRPAAGLHRAEGGLPEHPRRLRRQPDRLPGRAQSSPTPSTTTPS